MTQVFLAWSQSGQSRKTFADWDWDADPVRFLVSFHYLATYERRAGANGYRPVSMMLDSGAFSAWKSGVDIDEAALIEEAQNERWARVVPLDVVGDGEASWEATCRMRAALGPERVLPVFHIGEPFGLLARYCEEAPVVGLSCRFGETPTESTRWLAQCFARQWPHRFHSFGYAKEDVLFEFPFWSIDTASWNNGPSIWGRWRSPNGPPGVVRLNNVAAEVHHYRELERRLRHRWSKELLQWSPSISASPSAPLEMS